MRINGFHIEGFGHFHDVGVKQITSGLNLFYGENEGGKSTLLAFIRSVLYGFNAKKSEHQYPPLSGGKQGGRLFLHDEEQNAYILERFAGKKGGEAHLFQADGEELSQEQLEKLLGSSNEQLFRSVYAFSLEELQTFDSLKKDEIKQGLYSAATGGELKKLPEFEKKLQKEMEALYRPMGKKQEINLIVKELEELDAQIAEEEKNASSFSELAERRKKEEACIDEQQKIIDMLNIHLQSCNASLESFPLQEELQEFEKKMKQFPPLFSTVSIEKQEALKTALKQLADQREMVQKREEEKSVLAEGLHGSLSRIDLEKEEKELIALKEHLETVHETELLLKRGEEEKEQEWQKLVTGSGISTERLVKREEINNALLKMKAIKAEQKSSAESVKGVKKRILSVSAGLFFLFLLLLFATPFKEWVNSVPLWEWLPVAGGVSLFLTLLLFIYSKAWLAEKEKAKEETLKAFEEVFGSSLSLPQTEAEWDKLQNLLEHTFQVLIQQEESKLVKEEHEKEVETVLQEVSSRLQKTGNENEKEAHPLSLSEGKKKIEELFVTLRHRFEEVARKEQRQEQLNKKQDELMLAKAELLKISTNIEELQKIYSCSDENELSAFIQKADEYLFLKQKKEEAEKRLDAVTCSLPKGEANFKIFNTKEELVKQKDDLHARIEQEEKKRDMHQNAKGRLDQQVESLASSEQLSILKERKEAVEENLSHLGKKWARFAVASGLLKRAKEEFEQEEQPKVLKIAGDILAHFTEGKYRNIHLPLEEKSRPQIVCDDGSRKNLLDLSRGTAEQLYLAIRLGYINSAPPQIPLLPIVIDDILVNFDAKRAEATARYLVELSKSRQILFFSCHLRMIELFESLAPSSSRFNVENRTCLPVA